MYIERGLIGGAIATGVYGFYALYKYKAYRCSALDSNMAQFIGAQCTLEAINQKIHACTFPDSSMFLNNQIYSITALLNCKDVPKPPLQLSGYPCDAYMILRDGCQQAQAELIVSVSLIALAVIGFLYIKLHAAKLKEIPSQQGLMLTHRVMVRTRTGAYS